MATKVVDLGKVTGPAGPAGTDGKSAYQQAVAGGYTGTEAEFQAILGSGPWLPVAGGTLTGNLNMGGRNIENALYVLASIIGDSSGSLYVRGSNELVLQSNAEGYDALRITDAGITSYKKLDMTEHKISGISTPTDPADATPKSYVDAETAKCLPKSGGTLTGALTVSDLTVNGSLRIVDKSDIEMNNGSIVGLKSPSLSTDAVNKEYVDGKQLVFTGKTVLVSAWASNTTYSAQGYAWRATVNCAGVTTYYRPDVTFGVADALSGNFAPVADSYSGGVYIYAKTKPAATIAIPSIVCVKGA